MEDGSNLAATGGSIDRVEDVIDGVRRYARQETVEPIKGAAKWVAVGTIAALSLGLAVIFAAIGTLRLVQDAAGPSLEAGWSFVPYLISALVLVLIVAVVFSRIGQDSLQRNRRA